MNLTFSRVLLKHLFSKEILHPKWSFTSNTFTEHRGVGVGPGSSISFKSQLGGFASLFLILNLSLNPKFVTRHIFAVFLAKRKYVPFVPKNEWNTPTDNDYEMQENMLRFYILRPWSSGGTPSGTLMFHAASVPAVVQGNYWKNVPPQSSLKLSFHCTPAINSEQHVLATWDTLSFTWASLWPDSFFSKKLLQH